MDKYDYHAMTIEYAYDGMNPRLYEMYSGLIFQDKFLLILLPLFFLS
jgi:hypothetical protein